MSSLTRPGAAPGGAGSGSFPPRAHQRSKQSCCDAFISRLQDRGDIDIGAAGFIEGICAHFERLPTRYALDVNIDSLDVLSHKRLLDEARLDPTTVSFAVRSVEVLHTRPRESTDGLPSPAFLEASPRRGVMQAMRRQPLPKPAFGSSPNLQALALEFGERVDASHDGSQAQDASNNSPDSTFYEITIATVDQPKLLSRLSDAMGDLGLNIREAHVFNTTDGFALDVFVVDGWSSELGESLEEQLGQRLLRMPPPPQLPPRVRQGQQQVLEQQQQPAMFQLPAEAPPVLGEPMPPPGAAGWNIRSPSGAAGGSPAPDDWEIDISQLHIDAKVAAGSFSNLYRGYYCGQEVAVKILKEMQDDASQYQEFLQEVSIMRKVRHKNVVQFIGACTRKPNLCIVFEYMSGGSVYDYIRREGALKLSQVLKVCVEVSRGMDYLHQRKIIHRDLKAANLLLDENGTVKIADFGVARMIETNGHMTAETGTYRWMAPEVIEHKPYDEKADVFSFGVVLWELLTCKIPYSDMTPLQAAVGVVQKGLRPAIPQSCPPQLASMMAACWDASPLHRPSFKELTPQLQLLLDMVRDDEARKAAAAAAAAGSKGGLLSKLNINRSKEGAGSSRDGARG
ncbi:STY17 [Scenedesmus sp. PABB004]|nr:STY17 [Scenedesmus sp. PABB004]